LPLPRIIQPADNTFEWPALKRGLRQRLKDEESIKMLQQKAEDAVKSGDPNQIRKVLAAICEVAYGKGVTPQDRQDFLIVRSPMETGYIFSFQNSFCFMILNLEEIWVCCLF